MCFFDVVASRLTRVLVRSPPLPSTSNVKIDVYDYDEHSANDLIGSFAATVAELKAKITNGVKVSKTQMVRAL